ncbi:MAG: leucine-rich repeat protein, partial [Ruminococcus sp.]|nr:leucine-rich repeat protein [Ruminococcus sp.]
MKSFFKKTLSAVLAVMMLLTVMPIAASAAFADESVSVESPIDDHAAEISAETTLAEKTQPSEAAAAETVLTKETQPATEPTTTPKHQSKVSEPVSANGSEFITRAEWLHNLAITFNMTVEEENYPDNYFSDITSSDSYYHDIMLATEFGVIDIAAGGEVHPNDNVTRDFAASTLNYCLGFKVEEGTSYTFSDAEQTTHPDDAQIALDRGWFTLIDGAFAEATEVTFEQSEAMLADAALVLADSKVDDDHNNEYQFAEGVKVVTQGTVCERTDNTITIYSSPVEINQGDTFAVFLSDVPETFIAQSVSTEGNRTVVTVADNEQSGMVSADAQGTEDVYEDYIEPAEGIELEYEYEDNAVSSPKTGEAVGASGSKLIKSIKTKWGPIGIKISNMLVEYIVDTQNRHFMVQLNGDADITITASSSDIQKILGGSGAQASLDLFCYNVPGIGKASVSIYAGIEGEIVVNYGVKFNAGFEYTGDGGFRGVKNFTKKSFSITLNIELDVGISASVNVDILKVVHGSIWARAGFKALLSLTVFPDSNSPHECRTIKAYIYANMGFSAGIKFLGFDKSEQKTFTIFDENNSPVRLYFHFEDGEPVFNCARGINYYSSSYSSRYGYCTYGGARSTGFNAAGEPFTIFTYDLDSDNNATITSYKGNVSSLSIPSTLDGYTVTGIGYGAFQNNQLLRSVIIPDSVTTIGNYAFEKCRQLTTLKLSKSLEELGYRAFAYTAVTSVEIP